MVETLPNGWGKWLHAYIDESQNMNMNIVVPKIFAKTRYNDNDGTGTGIDIEVPAAFKSKVIRER